MGAPDALVDFHTGRHVITLLRDVRPDGQRRAKGEEQPPPADVPQRAAPGPP